ncbi:MAG: DUF4652 domain-containing protein [Halarsenatibacteraceae bacterium]
MGAHIKKIIIVLFIILVMFGTGFYLAYYNFDQLADSKSISEDMIEYQEESYLRLSRESGVEVLSEEMPSEPIISPDGDKLAFIDPFQWETVGSIFLYDYQANSLTELLKADQVEEQATPKGIWWYNDDYLLAIIGYAYGTVSVGGDLYLVDVETGNPRRVLGLNEYQEVKDISLDDQYIYLEIAEFDEAYNDYEVIEDRINRDRLDDVI